MHAPHRPHVSVRSLGFLLWQMTRAAFLAEEKNSLLGLLWHLLNPLAMTAVLYITFTSIGRPAAVPHYALFILIGVIHFNFFANATTKAADGILRSRNLVLNTMAPLELLVLRHICIEGLTLAIELIVLCVLISITGAGLTAAALGYVVVLAGLIMLTFGAALILATMVVFMTDVTYVWAMGTRMLFFLTPVFYSPDTIDSTAVRVAATLNPLSAIITMARDSLLYGQSAAVWSIAVVVIGPLVVLTAAWKVFNNLKGRIPDYI